MNKKTWWWSMGTEITKPLEGWFQNHTENLSKIEITADPTWISSPQLLMGLISVFGLLVAECTPDNIWAWCSWWVSRWCPGEGGGGISSQTWMLDRYLVVSDAPVQNVPWVIDWNSVRGNVRPSHWLQCLRHPGAAHPLWPHEAGQRPAPGGTRRNQEEPGGTRRNQEEPGSSRYLTAVKVSGSITFTTASPCWFTTCATCSTFNESKLFTVTPLTELFVAQHE